MKVEARLHHPLQQALGGEKVELRLGRRMSLKEALRMLCREHAGAERYIFQGDELRRDLIFMVNGVGINHLQAERTEVRDEDEVLIVPAIAGGKGLILRSCSINTGCGMPEKPQ